MEIAICAAFKILGLKSYHWNEVLSNKNNAHLQLWLNAVKAKYDGIGKPFKGEDFDQMLWDYDVNAPSPQRHIHYPSFVALWGDLHISNNLPG